MRTITPTERALLGGSALGVHVKLLVANASGSLIDLSTWVVDWNIEISVDAPVSSLSLSLKREDGASSLAPLLSSSTLNRNNGGSYAPLIDVARRIQFWTAVTALGVAPVTADWKQMFEGVIDTHDASANSIKVAARDLGAVLLDTQIQQAINYGSPTGVAVETAMEQIIRDNVLTNPPALVVPISPNWDILEYLQDTTNVFDAIRALALQIGWDVRYVWSGAAFNLTLYQPDRFKSAADASIPPTEYLDVNQLLIDRSGIRNIIEIQFSDSANNQQRTTSVFSDGTSRAKYGDQYMSIGLDSTSNVNTAVDVAKMGAAALADLSTPALAQGIETLYWWPAQLGDLYTFSANNVHYDAAQSLAVIGVSHSGTGTGKARTVIKCKGKPVGAHAYWLTRGPIQTSAGVVPNVPEILFVNSPPTAVYDRGTFLGWRLSGAVDSDTAALVVALTPGLSMFSSTPNFVSATGANGGPEYWLDISGPLKSFTIEVHQPATSNDEILLEPHAVYNPASANPRPGAVGEIWDLPLTREPVTVADVRSPSSTLRSITLTVSPATATIKYRLDPTDISDPWISDNETGSITIGDGSLTDPFIDVSASDRLLEYYGVSVDGLLEPVHRLVLDLNTTPSLVLTLSEPMSSVLQIDATLDDDVVHWRVWAKRNADPYLNPGDPDPVYLWWDNPRDKQEDRRAAYGDGGGTSTWHVVARAYDVNGQYSEVTGTILMHGGGGGGGGSPAPTLFNRYAQWVTPNIDVFWTPNATITGATAGTYLIRALVNGVEKEPLASALDAAAGVWAFPAGIVAAGTAGAEWATWNFTLELYAATDLTTVLGSYTVVYSDWIAGSTGGPGGPSTPVPTGAPPDPTVTASIAGSLSATASWATPTPGLQIDIEWYEDSTSAFVGQFLFDTQTLAAGVTTHTAVNFDALSWARCRIRYRNISGPSVTWSAWSNGVLIPSRGHLF